MKVAHFYHAYCMGEGWEDAVLGHAEALTASEWEGPVNVGLVGESAESRSRALCMLPKTKIVAEATSAWEQLTLTQVHRRSTRPGPFDAILYAHTKGAANPSAFNTRWRESMTNHVIEGWRECIRWLEKGNDVVGCHWLTHADYPNRSADMADGFFGGNFWMAKCSYLARLPECAMDSRWDAESWIGLGKPKVHDLLEGWPSVEAFERGGLRCA